MNKEGHIITHYGEGKILDEWYLCGKKLSESNYVDGELDGRTTFYHPNGNVRLQVDYKKGRRHGLIKDYYEDGKIRTIETWYKGKRHGGYESFDSQGKRIKYIIYNYGKVHQDLLRLSAL